MRIARFLPLFAALLGCGADAKTHSPTQHGEDASTPGDHDSDSHDAGMKPTGDHGSGSDASAASGDGDVASGDGDQPEPTTDAGGAASDDAGGSSGNGTPDCTPGGSGLVVDGDVVLDKKTCLVWQRGEGTQPVYCDMTDRNPMGYCWTAAVNDCEDLKLGGADDFRLPSEAELLTIVDKSQYPTDDASAFPDTQLKFYWTSKEVSSDHAWCVDFTSGNASPSAAKWGGQAYRCVRGPALSD
jgi:hypothetical protein